MQKTSASTVCGSCRPLLAELLGGVVKAEKIKAVRSFLSMSIITGIAAAIAILLPGLWYNQSAEEALQWDLIWRDGTLKQVTGYTVLSLTLISLLVSLRKRWKRFTLLQFATWRYAHVLIGLFILMGLFAHTGFRIGHNLNAWLMACFTGLILVGGIYGVFMSIQHHLDGVLVQRIRSYFNWTHLLLFWPVPVLLTFHIFKIYYF